MSFGYGIVGLGRAAERLAMSLDEVSGIHIEAVCSANRDKAARFADRFGATTIYSRYADMVEDPAVSAVIVASVNSAHREQVLEAAAAGKSVFCEKPLGCDLAEAQAMIDGCATAGVRFAVGYHHRFHPLVQRARTLVADGAIGDLLLARAHFYVGPGYDRSGWRSEHRLAGGGALVSTGVHMIDTVNFILRSAPQAGALIADGLPVEESCTFTLSYPPGILVVFDTSRSVGVGMRHNDIQLFGTEGHLTLHSILGGPIAGGSLSGETKDGTVRSRQKRHLNLYTAELTDLARAVESDGELLADACAELPVADALRMLYENSIASSQATVA